MLSNITKRSRSILEEISAFVPEKSKEDFIEARANHVINSAIHLLEIIDNTFNEEHALVLRRKLLNSIQQSDPGKFTRAVRRLKE